MTNLFEVGGFQVLVDDSEEATRSERFRESGARVACLCGTDERHADEAAAAARALKDAGAARVMLAGRPGDLEDELRRAGVDPFVFAGCDVLELLGSLLAEAGVATEGGES